MKVGDVVIGAGASLAGRVVQVSDRSCQVRLLSDPEFSVTAEVASTGAIVTGFEGNRGLVERARANARATPSPMPPRMPASASVQP